jgi:DNA-binding NarL/FixJ family response regulator
MTTILIVDDNVDFRKRVRSTVSPEPGLKVIGEAQDGERAVLETERLHPDVVLMDVRMPRMNGLEATRRIMERAPATRVIILSQFDIDEYRQAARSSGAADFIIKKSILNRLLPVIRRCGLDGAADGAPADPVREPGPGE